MNKAQLQQLHEDGKRINSGAVVLCGASYAWLKQAGVKIFDMAIAYDRTKDALQRAPHAAPWAVRIYRGLWNTWFADSVPKHKRGMMTRTAGVAFLKRCNVDSRVRDAALLLANTEDLGDTFAAYVEQILAEEISEGRLLP